MSRHLRMGTGVFSVCACLALSASAFAQAGSPEPINSCSITMSPEKAAIVLTTFSQDTSIKRKVDNGGILLSTAIDNRSGSPMELEVEGTLASSFEFQRGGKWGMLRTPTTPGVEMPYRVFYDPAQGKLTAELVGKPRAIQLFVEVSGTTNSDVARSGQNSIGLTRGSADMPTDGKKPAPPPQTTEPSPGFDFGLNVNEMRTSNVRKLSASASGLPALLQPVVECIPGQEAVILGVRLLMDFELDLDVKFIATTINEMEDREVKVSLLDRVFGASSGGSSRRIITKDALMGTVSVKASGDGLFTAVVADPGQSGAADNVAFAMEAFLVFVFDLNATPLTTVRGGDKQQMPTCRLGKSC